MCDKAFNIAKKSKNDGYHYGLASVVDKFFDKKTSGSGIKSTIISDQQLAEELQKPITRELKIRKVQSYFKDNICGTDIADMQSLCIFNNGIRFLLRVTDILSKYAWAIPLKDKKGITITNAFQKILDVPNHKPNKYA